MAASALVEAGVLGDLLRNGRRGVAGKTVAAAGRVGVGALFMALDTFKHDAVVGVLLDIFNQRGVAAHTIAATGKKSRAGGMEDQQFFHGAIITTATLTVSFAVSPAWRIRRRGRKNGRNGRGVEPGRGGV